MKIDMEKTIEEMKNLKDGEMLSILIDGTIEKTVLKEEKGEPEDERERD